MIGAFPRKQPVKKAGADAPAGKTVIFIFLGTGMISVMPVPLYPLNKPLYILCRQLLLVDLPLQTFDLNL